MEQLGSCTATGSLERYSSEPRRSVRDRFRGALIGLSLAPTAVSAQLSADSSVNKLSECAAFSLEQTRVFLRQPHAFDLSHVQTASCSYDSELIGSESVLWASIPVLLRYHDSWQRRLQWVSDGWQRSASAPSSWALTGSSQPAQADIFAQVLVLGELLELLLNGHCLPIAGLSQLQERPTAIALSTHLPVIAPHYRRILAALWTGASNASPPASLQSLSAASEATARQGFVDAALIALRYLESYPISVQMAAKQGGTAPLVTALIAGAWGGQASLPALWQTSPYCPKILAMADDLFTLWAGVAR